MKLSSKAVLVISILGALGGWMASAPHWTDLATPQALSGLIVLVVANLAAAFGVNSRPINTSTTTTTVVEEPKS